MDKKTNETKSTKWGILKYLSEFLFERDKYIPEKKETTDACETGS
jgi:hypothetical protein